jgi:hypothetical protein
MPQRASAAGVQGDQIICFATVAANFDSSGHGFGRIYARRYPADSIDPESTCHVVWRNKTRIERRFCNSNSNYGSCPRQIAVSRFVSFRLELTDQNRSPRFRTDQNHAPNRTRDLERTGMFCVI